MHHIMVALTLQQSQYVLKKMFLLSLPSKVEKFILLFCAEVENETINRFWYLLYFCIWGNCIAQIFADLTLN